MIDFKKNAEDLIEDLENSRVEHFDMRDIEHCISGQCWKRYAKAIDVTRHQVFAGIGPNVTRWLGIHARTAEKLCVPTGFVELSDSPWAGVEGITPGTVYLATQQQAAQAIRNAIRISEEQ